ncbi:MAG: hypothetical protein EZS28_025684 [Streblomastix strix]|uniref:Uncharacterized protein n=1 Tax=Streblomastix strix TaxID=222440 RepID=A0A5J4V8G7_9EUKA|nr:MAG: hypothetical protein EZS28_025684 [Streblomastix strix]
MRIIYERLNNLIFLFVLTALFQGIYQANENDITHLTYNHLSVYEKDGILYRDFSTSTRGKLSDLKPLTSNTFAPNRSFNLFTSVELAALRALQPLGFDSTKCPKVDHIVTLGWHSLLGLSSYARDKAIDIAPSIVYAIEKLPQSYIEISANGNERKIDTNRGCLTSHYLVQDSFEVYGIVDSWCVSNNQIMKDYQDATDNIKTTSDAPTECGNTTSGIRRQPVQGFWGEFEPLSVDEVKAFILRVGPIQIVDVAANINKPIIIGWNEKEWVVLKWKQIYDSSGYADYVYEQSTLPFSLGGNELKFGGQFFYVPEQTPCVPDKETTLIECPCIDVSGLRSLSFPLLLAEKFLYKIPSFSQTERWLYVKDVISFSQAQDIPQKRVVRTNKKIKLFNLLKMKIQIIIRE